MCAAGVCSNRDGLSESRYNFLSDSIVQVNPSFEIVLSVFVVAAVYCGSNEISQMINEADK